MANPVSEAGAPRRPSPRRLAAWAAITLVLAATFTAYLDPELMVDLASRVWACF